MPRSGEHGRMPLLLSARAVTASPLPLIQAAEARRLGIRLDPSTHARLRKGIYVDRAAYLSLQTWERYAVRVHAFVLQHPSAVLCLESAAVVHGLPLFGAPRDIHVYDAGRTASRRFGDVAVHTWDDSREVDEVDGILVVALVDTVVDLGRVLQPAPALAVADAAVSRAQGGAASLLQLRDRAASQGTRRGSARLRWLWDHVDGASESPGESVSRAVIEWAGFAPPELQREFSYEGCLDRADFYFAEKRAIGESDGWQKYGLGDPDAAARRLADEKRREDRLRRNGHPFARWDLADAWRVEPVVRALRATGIRVVRPPDAAFLTTLTRRTR